MSKHTLGPWRATKDGYVKSGNITVGDAYHNSYDSRGSKIGTLPYEANARLMAAAPEMLRLIQRLTSPYMAEPQYRMDAFIDANEIVKQITQGDEVE